ncbi:MAG: hypothetical protein H6R10_2188 [Rhodocyclaceae bacterium]|nr:hypothetical protein [Rhodocyclaceae bacterium]
MRWHRRGAGPCLVALYLALAGFGVSADETSLTDIDYRLGSGLRIPATGFALGGYANVNYHDDPHGPSRTALHNLSLFVWWEGEGRWKFFSELDYENLLSSGPDSLESENEGRYLALERLYFDYSLNDSTNIRAGKFLTPIGRWNLIHATPLVWTTSRPLVTNQVFPTNVTGLMATGTLPAKAIGIEYSLYASNGREIRSNPAQDPFYEVVGGHLALPLAEGQVGFSWASFEQKKSRDERKRLLGIDFQWSRQRYEISTEAVYRFSNNGGSWDEKGAFLQVAAPLSERLYAVGRYDAFRKARETATTQLWLAGLNYRITPAIVLKAEWISGHNNSIDAPEGFLSSISILF